MPDQRIIDALKKIGYDPTPQPDKSGLEAEIERRFTRPSTPVSSAPSEPVSNAGVSAPAGFSAPKLPMLMKGGETQSRLDENYAGRPGAYYGAARAEDIAGLKDWRKKGWAQKTVGDTADTLLGALDMLWQAYARPTLGGPKAMADISPEFKREYYDPWMSAWDPTVSKEEYGRPESNLSYNILYGIKDLIGPSIEKKGTFGRTAYDIGRAILQPPTVVGLFDETRAAAKDAGTSFGDVFNRGYESFEDMPTPYQTGSNLYDPLDLVGGPFGRLAKSTGPIAKGVAKVPYLGSVFAPAAKELGRFTDPIVKQGGALKTADELGMKAGEAMRWDMLKNPINAAKRFFGASPDSLANEKMVNAISYVTDPIDQARKTFNSAEAMGQALDDAFDATKAMSRPDTKLGSAARSQKGQEVLNIGEGLSDMGKTMAQQYDAMQPAWADAYKLAKESGQDVNEWLNAAKANKAHPFHENANLLSRVPRNLEELQYTMLAKVAEYTGKAAAEMYGVSSPGSWSLFNNVMKTAQSYLFLATSPMYAMMNILNNAATAMFHDVGGVIDASKVWEKFGFPPRARSGLGAVGIETGGFGIKADDAYEAGRKAIQKAAKESGGAASDAIKRWEKIQGWIGAPAKSDRLAAKVLTSPMRFAQKAEQWQGEMATAIGTLRSWHQLWPKVIPDIDPVLLSGLQEAGLLEDFTALVRSSSNPQELVEALYKRKRPSARYVLERMDIGEDELSLLTENYPSLLNRMDEAANPIDEALDIASEQIPRRGALMEKQAEQILDFDKRITEDGQLGAIVGINRNIGELLRDAYSRVDELKDNYFRFRATDWEITKQLIDETFEYAFDLTDKRIKQMKDWLSSKGYKPDDWFIDTEAWKKERLAVTKVVRDLPPEKVLERRKAWEDYFAWFDMKKQIADRNMHVGMASDVNAAPFVEPMVLANAEAQNAYRMLQVETWNKIDSLGDGTSKEIRAAKNRIWAEHAERRAAIFGEADRVWKEQYDNYVAQVKAARTPVERVVEEAVDVADEVVEAAPEAARFAGDPLTPTGPKTLSEWTDDNLIEGITQSRENIANLERQVAAEADKEKLYHLRKHIEIYQDAEKRLTQELNLRSTRVADEVVEAAQEATPAKYIRLAERADDFDVFEAMYNWGAEAVETGENIPPREVLEEMVGKIDDDDWRLLEEAWESGRDEYEHYLEFQDYDAARTALELFNPTTGKSKHNFHTQVALPRSKGNAVKEVSDYEHRFRGVPWWDYTVTMHNLEGANGEDIIQAALRDYNQITSTVREYESRYGKSAPKGGWKSPKKPVVSKPEVAAAAVPITPAKAAEPIETLFDTSHPNMALDLVDLDTAGMDSVLRALPQIAERMVTTPVGDYQRLSPEMLELLVKHVQDNVVPAMNDARLGARELGQWMRDQAMLNYNRRYGYNQVLGYIYPYEFWFTTSLGHWARKFMQQPQLLSTYARMKQSLIDTEENLPARLKGMIRVKMPFLPEWMGDYFVDVLTIGLPFQNFLYPLEAAEWGSEKEQLEADLAKAIKDGAPQDVIDEIRMNIANVPRQGMYETLGSFMSPGLQWKLADLFANPDKDLGDLEMLMPGSRFLKGATALAGINEGQGIDVEGGLRERVNSIFGTNLPTVGAWDDYLIQRMLANMAQQGEITNDEAQRAMIEKTGTAWEMAKAKAAQETGFKAISPWRDALLPAGEEQLRGVSADRSALYQSKPAEDSPEFDAWKERERAWYAAHPEFTTKQQTYKLPGAQYRDYLGSYIWAEVNKSPQAYKLAWDLFETEMQALRAKTATTEQLARVADTLGIAFPTMQVPQNSPVPPGFVGGKPMFESTITDEQVETFANYLSEIEKRFGRGIYQTQTEFYNREGNAAKEYKAQHPELERYWEFSRTWKEDNPELAKIAGYDTKQTQWLENATPAQSKAYEDYQAEIKTRFGEGIYMVQSLYYASENKQYRKNFLEKHPELKAYWDFARDWKEKNPAITKIVTEQRELRDREELLRQVAERFARQ